MIRRILLGLAGTTYTPIAIDRAVNIAAAQGAEITGVTVFDRQRVGSLSGAVAPPWEDAVEIHRERLEISEEQIRVSIEAFESACQAAQVKHRLIEESGDALTRLIDVSRYHDLMVFGLRSLFEFNILPDPHDALVRLVQAGVRPLIAVTKGHYPIHKVLIAYSGSMESAKAMKRFVQMRLWPDARLRIVTCEHPRDEAEQLVGDAAEYCRAHGFEVEEAYVPESPKSHLLPYAEAWGADLIVIGNSAKNLLLRRILGETALHAIRHSDRPLFLAQ